MYNKLANFYVKVRFFEMSKIKITVLILAIVAGMFSASGTFAETPGNIEFQAEFLERDYDEVTKGKIYIASDMSRYEVSGSGEIIVTRQDKKVIWLIFPRMARYVEQDYIGEPYKVFADPSAPAGDNLTREFIDFEWIDSYRLRKFLVTVTYPKGEDKYYEWFRDNFPIPVKTESLDGKVSFEYQKIKFGPQNPELFAVPRRYKKVDMEEIIIMEEAAKNEKKK